VRICHGSVRPQIKDEADPSVSFTTPVACLADLSDVPLSKWIIPLDVLHLAHTRVQLAYECDVVLL
jgi:hypothetical protein